MTNSGEQTESLSILAAFNSRQLIFSLFLFPSRSLSRPSHLIRYYETVAGGSGAGPTWHGRSGVHVHMTNTRLTDPEILERRYPVILQHFSLAEGSGGRGAFDGGDGVLRKIQFRKNLTLSILTERRVLSPYGMSGGEDGRKGVNLLVKRGIKGGSEKTLYLGGKCAIPVEAGDVFSLQTPGGGGWGRKCEARGAEEEQDEDGTDQKPITFTEKGSLYDYQQMQHSA